MHQSPGVIFGAVLFLAATLGNGHAAPTITFSEAVERASGGPAVRGMERALEAKRTFDAQISRIPANPTLGMQPGARLSSGAVRGPEFLAEIAQPLGAVGYGAARRDSAAREEAQLAGELQTERLARGLAAARAWIDRWAAEQVEVELRQEAAVAAEVERLVARALELGGATRAELADARTFHAEQRTAVIAAEGESLQRGLALARETAAAAEPLGTAGGLPSAAVPEPAAYAALLARAGELPAPRARALAAQATRAREAEERASRATAVQVGLALQNDDGAGMVLYGSARVTAPILERGERERGTYAAAAERQQGEHHQEVIAARTELAGALHELEHTAALVAVLQDDLVPAAREGAATRRRLYQQGGGTVLEVLQAERAAIAAGTRLQQARAAHAWARVKVHLLTASLTGAPRGAR